MKKFIPKNPEELISRMKKEKFKGEYISRNDKVVWYISDKMKLEIILNNNPSEAYVSYYARLDDKIFYLTHEHPLMEDLYNLLEELNRETNILLVKKSIFGKISRLYFASNEDFKEEKYKNKKRYEIYKF